MVFHTAPPQPASKALCICAPVLVGGAEASQNGLGDLMPAKLMRRSAMLISPRLLSGAAKAVHGLLSPPVFHLAPPSPLRLLRPRECNLRLHRHRRCLSGSLHPLQ